MGGWGRGSASRHPRGACVRAALAGSLVGRATAYLCAGDVDDGVGALRVAEVVEGTVHAGEGESGRGVDPGPGGDALALVVWEGIEELEGVAGEVGKG